MKFTLDSFALREASTLDPEHDARLRKLPLDYPDLWLDWFKRGLAGGTIHLSAVSCQGRDIGSLLWRIESEAERELVIMAAASSDPKISMTEFLSQAVDALAVELHCRSARFHTTRPALVALGHTHGWETSEIVLRKYYG